jgi:hypothetical protein
MGEMGTFFVGEPLGRGGWEKYPYSLWKNNVEMELREMRRERRDGNHGNVKRRHFISVMTFLFRNSNQFLERLSNCLLTGRLFGWFIGWLIGGSVSPSVVRSVGLLIVRLVGELFDCSVKYAVVRWSFGWLMGQSIGTEQ